MKNLIKPVPLSIVATITAMTHIPKLSAHGTMVVPESRIYKCRFNGNPENHQDPACRAAVQAGGTQPLYDWNAVRRGDANGQHQAIIADGQLCSGGNSTFRGLDLLRSDWQTTSIAGNANGQFEFVYHATAPHATREMIFYITPEGWNPLQPLRWSEMEEFCRHEQVPLVDIPGGRKGYRMTCDLPARTGQHVIYNIWQRSDSPEAFYSCSDVQFSDTPDTDLIALGTVVANEDLPTGTILTFRLMDEAFSDIESISIELRGNESGSTIWPFVLAQTVNAQSQFVRIGRLDENAEIGPTTVPNANVVYSLSNRSFSFVIDKKRPNDPTDPDDPVNPDEPDDDGTVDFDYPEAIGQYGPGTIVNGRDGNHYQCRPFPFSGWCNQAPAYYEPGHGYAWKEAWTKL